MQLEQLILSHLIQNEDYTRKCLPFLKKEYFQQKQCEYVFDLIQEYVGKYNNLPTPESLQIELQSKDNLNEDVFNTATAAISELREIEPAKLQWIVDKTEEFCQERALYNALMTSIHIHNDKTGKLAKGSIPKILTDALAISFDGHIGHNFTEDAERRYDFYHRVESKIEFDLDYFNKITRGGISRKSLTVILAGPHVGKSLVMCHMSAANLSAGKNVLYITNEMSEEMIAERIDANLMNLRLDELHTITRDVFTKKIDRIKSKTNGKLIIKEYPTASAGALHFRNLVNELRLKKNFIPDIIYIDYLNICISTRIKMGSGINTYTYVKSIAEELRGLAVELDVPIITATQTNREGFNNSDPGMENTSESFGLPATADFMIALIVNDELKAMNQMLIKQLKNRFGDVNTYNKFVIGVDRTRFKLYDVEQTAQDGLIDGPVMDNTNFGEQDSERSKPKRKSFSGFK